MLKFRQWGYFRTGTNATRAVLEANWDCEVISTRKPHGKHRPFADPRPGEIHIVSIRNPWTTIQKWAERKDKSYEYGLEHYLPEYIERYNSWLDGVEQYGGFVVVQEQLAIMPTILLGCMARQLDLPLPLMWKIPARHMGISTDDKPLVFNPEPMIPPFVPHKESLTDQATRMLHRVGSYMANNIWENYYQEDI